MAFYVWIYFSSVYEKLTLRSELSCSSSQKHICLRCASMTAKVIG